jgi:hypothetical protein
MSYTSAFSVHVLEQLRDQDQCDMKLISRLSIYKTKKRKLQTFIRKACRVPSIHLQSSLISAGGAARKVEDRTEMLGKAGTQNEQEGRE